MTDKDDVAQFLRDNPDFFAEFPDLLAQQTAHRDHNGSPFIERQLRVLKDREAEQRQCIDLIIDSVRHGRKLEQDLVRFAGALLAAGPPAEPPRQAVSALLERQFNIQAVLILAGDEPAHAHWPELKPRVGHGGSVCDDRVSSQLRRGVFGAPADGIQSCAFIPVTADGQIKGAAALGAAERERFQPDMGVVFLDNLGALISSCLRGQGVL